MTKGLEFEHDVRTVIETIYGKIGNKRSGRITLSDEDFLEGLNENPLFSFLSYKLLTNNDLSIIILQAEKEQRGKIKLVSTTPAVRFVKDGDREIKIKDYEIDFDIDRSPRKEITELFLSMTDTGVLYIFPNNTSKPVCYELKSLVKRDILAELAKNRPADTKVLHIQTGSNNISREVDQIRTGITKKLFINGKHVIPVTKAGGGYFLGEQYTLSKRNL